MKKNHAEAGRLGAIKTAVIMKQRKEDRILSYTLSPTLCGFCSQPLVYEKRHNKFCGSSCGAKHLNVNNHWRKNVTGYEGAILAKVEHAMLVRETHDKLSLEKIQNVCPICGNQSSKVFCSTKCDLAHRKAQRVALFHEGKLSAKSAKLILIDLHGHQCMDCGWAKLNPVTNKCPVELEHVDGNSANNMPDNLKLLCPNCHSLTPTYKALNVGQGRATRRARYRAGKSF